MPPSLSTLTRAAIPVLALSAITATGAAAQAPITNPQPPPAAPAEVPPLGGAAVQADGAAAPAGLPAVPASGRLARVEDRQLATTGSTVSVGGRSTTVPVRVSLRVGSTGRLVDRAQVGPGESFRLSGRATPGEALRLLVRRTDGGTEKADLAVGTVRRMRPTTASWYGPGLYGNRTACGQTLSRGLRGVAHKSLPCGTRLTVRFRGKTTRATVVDRGPFHAGREFDLTYATAQAIGFRAVGRVWVGKHG